MWGRLLGRVWLRRQHGRRPGRHVLMTVHLTLTIKSFLTREDVRGSHPLFFLTAVACWIFAIFTHNSLLGGRKWGKKNLQNQTRTTSFSNWKFLDMQIYYNHGAMRKLLEKKYEKIAKTCRESAS